MKFAIPATSRQSNGVRSLEAECSNSVHQRATAVDEQHRRAAIEARGHSELQGGASGSKNQPACLSVCVCVFVRVSERHFYPSTLTDFDETWSQGPYSDLVWLRP